LQHHVEVKTTASAPFPKIVGFDICVIFITHLDINHIHI
jgi:hypothetical protein